MDASKNLSCFVRCNFIDRSPILFGSGDLVDRFVIILLCDDVLSRIFFALVLAARNLFVWVCVAGKGVWWMPWQTVPMKDVWGRDRPRGAADRALIRGFPNGGTRQPSWAGTAFARGVRREVKHLSTCRKRYSVSSGERKRIRPNRSRVIAVGRCAAGVVGRLVRSPMGPAGVRKKRVRRTGLNSRP